MPADLIRVEDADLDECGADSGVLAAYRAFLPLATSERRGLAILAHATTGAHQMLMLLARRVGAALRDENIRLRERGGDLKAGRQKLCYLPGRVLAAAIDEPGCRESLIMEAACFFQDLDGAWHASDDARASGAPLDPAALLR